MSGAQAAVLEDVPKVMEEFEGKKVAFYCTNCGIQVALQQAVINEENAYYPLPCCPSPFHGYQEAFGLEATYGDIDGAIANVANFLNENDAVGRFSTWAHPVAMTMIEIGVEYAKGYIDGDITSRNDAAKLGELMQAKVPGAVMNTYTDANGTNYDNYYTVLLAPVDFNDYLK